MKIKLFHHPSVSSKADYDNVVLHYSKDMYDVSISSSDDVVIYCHKCVLVARLEYFHSMLASGWMEVTNWKFHHICLVWIFLFLFLCP